MVFIYMYSTHFVGSSFRLTYVINMKGVNFYLFLALCIQSNRNDLAVPIDYINCHHK